MAEQEQPLVSVRVITYNSSKTVIETLDSIYNQTYPNIELIVSDDCSKDNTVAICRDWLEVHKGRFVRTELLTVRKNTGVAGNINRAEKACQGKWIKGIAGDDVFLPNSIQDCVDYVVSHPDTMFLFGKQKTFGALEERCKEIDKWFDYSFFNMTQEEQLHRLIFEGNCIPATTSFYHHERMKAIGVKNDERIPLLEDWPKWINLLRAGVHFDFLNKVIVMYRVSESSLSTATNQSLAFRQSNALFYQLYQFPYEFKEGNKKQAVEKWLRAQNLISTNKLWHIIFKLYKIIVMHKIH